MHPRRSLVILVSALGFGCGGSLDASSTDGGHHDSSSASDAAGPSDAEASWSRVCPASPPTLNTPCAIDAVYCEYGDAWWNPVCDKNFECLQGHWVSGLVGASVCIGQPAPNPTGCPPNEAATPNGGICPEGGLVCNYDQGVVCLCATIVGDAGVNRWDCVPEPNCPTTRPRLGSPCDGNITCTYQLCAYEEICTFSPSVDGGSWQPMDYNCQ